MGAVSEVVGLFVLCLAVVRCWQLFTFLGRG